MCVRSFRSGMHALTAAVGYVQMLFAMTYDLRIFVAIILGSGLGFFVLGPYFRHLTIQRTQRSSKTSTRNGHGTASPPPRPAVETERMFVESDTKGDNDERRHDSGQAAAAEGEAETGLLNSVDRESVL